MIATGRRRKRQRADANVPTITWLVLREALSGGSNRVLVLISIQYRLAEIHITLYIQTQSFVIYICRPV